MVCSSWLADPSSDNRDVPIVMRIQPMVSESFDASTPVGRAYPNRFPVHSIAPNLVIYCYIKVQTELDFMIPSTWLM